MQAALTFLQPGLQLQVANAQLNLYVILSKDGYWSKARTTSTNFSHAVECTANLSSEISPLMQANCQWV